METDPSRDQEKNRSAQVGFVMKAYRESFPRGDGGRGISQNEAIRRMASSDPDYTKMSNHSAVSRWETGTTPPTVRRLRVFGKAMNLSETEVDGLIILAGLDPEHDESSKLTCSACGGETQTVHVQKIRRTDDEVTKGTATIRTRKCRACGQTTQSRERWLDDHEETDKDRMHEALRKIEEANNRIKLAIMETDAVHRPLKPKWGPLEDQRPGGDGETG